MKLIRVIQPNNGEHLFTKKSRKRVCAYARVSNELRDTSYDLQISEYTTLIKENPEWDFVNIYTDKGLTGVRTDKRLGFQRMLRDSKNGLIDLIITKSISRFARNTIDVINSIKLLKEYGTEVFFERENLYSFDSTTKMFLTIIASVAEEETRTVSQNRKWAIKKSFLDGRPKLDKVLGYDVVDKYDFIINSKEAKIVKMIFEKYRKYRTYNKVKEYLEENKHITLTGNTVWHGTSIKNILRNHTYIGSLLLQKRITFNKVQQLNKDQYPKYLVNNHHEGIISKNMFKEVQSIMKESYRTTSSKKNKNEIFPFTGLAFCPVCGSYYKRKVNYYSYKGKREIARIQYCCANGLRRDTRLQKCSTRPVHEHALIGAAIKCLQETIYEHSFIEKFSLHFSSIQQSSNLSNKYDKLGERLEHINNQIESLKSLKLEDDFILKKLKNLTNEKLQKEFDYFNTKYQLYEQFSITNRLEEFTYFTNKYKQDEIQINNNEISKIFSKLIVAETSSIIFCIEKDFTISKIEFSNNIKDFVKAKPIHEGTYQYSHKGKQQLITYKVVTI